MFLLLQLFRRGGCLSTFNWSYCFEIQICCNHAGAYVSVLAGGGSSFKIRSTHRSIDDTLIQTKFVG